MDRDYIHSPARLKIRIGFRQIRNEPVHLSLCLRKAHERFQAANHGHPPPARSPVFLFPAIGPPKLRSLASQRTLRRKERDPRGHYPDYEITLAIETNEFADSTTLRAKAALPQSIAQKNFVIVPALPFLVRKIATQNGRDSKQRKQIRGNFLGRNLLRVAFSGERGSVVKECGQLLENSIVFLPVDEIRRGHNVVIASFVKFGLPYHHQALFLAIGKRFKQYGVHHAENRAARADPQGKREHSNRRKRGLVAKKPCGVAQVVKKFLRGAKGPHFAAPLFHACCVAELAARRVGGFFGGDAGAADFFFAHRQVKRDFFFEVAIQCVALED